MTISNLPSRLANIEVFRDEELQELSRCAQANPLFSLLKNPRWKEESAIDFAYTSAQIEGNTYSRADTITLPASGHSTNVARRCTSTRPGLAPILG